MGANINEFECDKCGKCCEILYPMFFGKDCVHYDKETYLCKIYDNRPNICRVVKDFERNKMCCDILKKMEVK